MRYTPKQIQKYKRQKYISHLEKIGRNLFKMFRDKSIDSNRFMDKFSSLIETLKELDEVRLNSEYFNESKSYYLNLYKKLNSIEFDDEYLNSIRESQMSQLNRLQKLKNRASYKKEKYKNIEFD